MNAVKHITFFGSVGMIWLCIFVLLATSGCVACRDNPRTCAVISAIAAGCVIASVEGLKGGSQSPVNTDRDHYRTY